MSMRTLLVVVPLLTLCAAGSFWLVRSANSGTSSQVGLSDEERFSARATVIAETGQKALRDALEFAESGKSLDTLPIMEIQSTARQETSSPDDAVRLSAAVVLVQSESGVIDPETGRLGLRVRVIETIKGEVPETIEISMAGGPQQLPGGGALVLAVAPYEVYLPAGTTAVLLLTDHPSNFRKVPATSVRRHHHRGRKSCFQGQFRFLGSAFGPHR